MLRHDGAVSTLEPVRPVPPGESFGEGLAKGITTVVLANKSLFQRLDELRNRLFRCLGALALAVLLAWLAYNPILHLLTGPLKSLPGSGDVVSRGKLIFTSPSEAFTVRIKLVVYTALGLASPVILWELWHFFAVGVRRRSSRMAVAVVVTSLILFAAGGAAAFLFVKPALELFLYLGGPHIVLVPSAAEYLSFLVLLIVAFGLTFEYPLFLLGLVGVGVLSSGLLRRKRRFAYFLLLVVSAAVTPTVDPITPLALAVPLALLYEATIATARLLKR